MGVNEVNSIDCLDSFKRENDIVYLPERKRIHGRTKSQILKVISEPDKNFGGHEKGWFTIKHKGDIFVYKVLSIEPLIVRSGRNTTLVLDQSNQAKEGK